MRCQYCGGQMVVERLATKDKGVILRCERCSATCQAKGRESWDWHRGRLRFLRRE